MIKVKKRKILLLPGDGIGPEARDGIAAEARDGIGPAHGARPFCHC